MRRLWYQAQDPAEDTAAADDPTKGNAASAGPFPSADPAKSNAASAGPFPSARRGDPVNPKQQLILLMVSNILDLW